MAEEEKNGTLAGGSCTIRYDAAKDSFETKMEGTIPLAGLIVALETMKFNLIFRQQAPNFAMMLQQAAMQQANARMQGLLGPDGMPFQR